jgi:thiol-disulfide isomerase/thioredoxin
MASPAPRARKGTTTPKGAPTSRRPARGAAARAAARRRKRLTWGMAAAGAAIVVAVGLFAASSGSGGTGVTKPAAFDLPALNGAGRIRLADFHGKPTVVNFFASWCTACDSELPTFSTVSAKLRGQVNFVGVDALETGDRMFMPRRHGITWWPLARDVGGANGSGLHDALCQCDSMPVTAFYDADGRLLNVDREALVGGALPAELQRYYGISV